MTFKINAVTDTETPTKNVLYYNYVFTVPEWVCYLATDSEGSLMGYDREPMKDDNNGWWDSGIGPIEMIARLDYGGDWRDSLVEV